MLQIYWNNRVVRPVAQDCLKALLLQQFWSHPVDQQPVLFPSLTGHLTFVDASLRKELKVSFGRALEKTKQLTECNYNEIRAVARLTLLKKFNLFRSRVSLVKPNRANCVLLFEFNQSRDRRTNKVSIRLVCTTLEHLR